jgi:hypothetical protein
MQVPTTGNPYAKKARPTAVTVGATTTGLIALQSTSIGHY